MVLGHIGASVFDQALDHRLHLRDMLGRPRLHIRLKTAERGHVGMKLRLRRLGDAPDGLVQGKARILLGRPRIDLVVDVGDVANIGDVLGAVEVAQQPVKHVEHDHRPRIADMGEVVDRRPAHIDADIPGIERPEWLLLAAKRVVERKHDDQAPSPRGSPFGSRNSE